MYIVTYWILLSIIWQNVTLNSILKSKYNVLPYWVKINPMAAILIYIERQLQTSTPLKLFGLCRSKQYTEAIASKHVYSWFGSFICVLWFSYLRTNHPLSFQPRSVAFTTGSIFFKHELANRKSPPYIVKCQAGTWRYQKLIIGLRVCIIVKQ